MRAEQAAELLDKNIKLVKTILKSKIGTYSLSFEPTLKKFVEKLKANDYEIIGKIPGNGEAEWRIRCQAKFTPIIFPYCFPILKERKMRR